MVGRRFAWVCGVTLALGMVAHSVAHAQVRSQELRASEDPGEFYSAAMQAGDTYILVGEQSLEDQKASVAVSGDSGATWTVHKTMAPGRLVAGYMFDAQNGLAVGEAGTALTTNDGGASWDVRTTKVQADLQGAFLLTADKGWAVGANSTIVTTSNGGSTWQVLQGGQPSGQVGEGEIMLMGVHFFDEKNGIVVGAGTEGAILSTKDGGKKLDIVYQSEDNFVDLVFSDADHGWAVGKYGLIVRTSDGGATWERLGSPTEEDLWDIDVGAPGTLWISGDQGVVGYSTDSGASWTLVGLHMTVFETTKSLTKPMRGVVAAGAKAWVSTEWGRVYYLELQ